MASGISKTDLTYFWFLIAMKLELDMWRHLLDVHTKFQIDMPKHLEKSPPESLKIPNTQK